MMRASSEVHDEENGNMTYLKWLAHIAVLVLVAGFASVPAVSTAIGPDDYADGGMKTCLKCHDETSEYPVLSILATKHAVKADERTPMAQSTECQTCHGPSGAHVKDLVDDEVRPPVGILFGPETPAGAQNEACLQCHQGGSRINWQGSVHQSSDIACVSCHTVHSHEDPVSVVDRRPDTPINRKGQGAVCFQCHQDTRAAIHKVSSHPLRDGMMQCSDCHNAHGSMGPTNLVKPTLNETCYTCHAEKRGPFAWEHAPAAEDCSICHTPHGSNHPTLLTARTPQLCQRCHAEGFHPSAAYEGPDYSAPFPGGNPVMQRQAGSKSCMNCHPEVHGTNHPSGSRLSR
jgi:DmsE family decaheme c-type cytochrome